MIKSASERWESLNEDEKILVNSIYNMYKNYDTDYSAFRAGITAAIFELYSHTRRGITRDSIR